MQTAFAFFVLSAALIGCADAQTPDQAATAGAAASADTVEIADGRVYAEYADLSAWSSRAPIPEVFAAARAHWQAQDPDYMEDAQVMAVTDGSFTEAGAAQQAVLYVMSFEPRCCPKTGIAVIQDGRVVRNVAFENPMQELRAVPDLDGDGRSELVTVGAFGMGGQNMTGFSILSFGDAGIVERSGPSILEESCAAMVEGGTAARVTAVPGPTFTIERFTMTSCESFGWQPAGAPEPLEIAAASGEAYVDLATP
ncbi:MAG TPA: hypothetical protein VIE68_09730 [Gemmatimonadota bacterium]|jgi:hypothetical protein